MDKLDLDKPLECEVNGEVIPVDAKGLSRGCLWVSTKSKDTQWMICIKTGISVDGFMPRVRNAKRKPKEGEWWMCRHLEDSGNVIPVERPLFLSKMGWRSSNINIDGEDDFKPLYPMIRDPSYKEQE